MQQQANGNGKAQEVNGDGIKLYEGKNNQKINLKDEYCDDQEFDDEDMMMGAVDPEFQMVKMPNPASQADVIAQSNNPNAIT